MCVCVCVYTHIYIYIHTCMYTHTCVYMHVQSLKLCPTLCNPMDYSSSGSSVHGLLQARILACITMPFSRDSSQPRDRTCVSCISYIVGGFFTHWTPGKAIYIYKHTHTHTHTHTYPSVNYLLRKRKLTTVNQNNMRCCSERLDLEKSRFTHTNNITNYSTNQPDKN